MINSIELQNFTKYATLKAEFPTAIVGIFGSNGAGKSSIRDAIRFALTGSCRNVKYKKDLNQIIRQGNKKATVKINIDETEIMRTQTTSGSQLYINNILAKDEQIQEMLKINPDLLNFCFDAENFLSSGTKERKEFLQNLCNAATGDVIFWEREIKALNLPEKIQKQVADLAVTGEYNTIIKCAIENRREDKRKLKEKQEIIQGHNSKIVIIDGKQFDVTQHTAESIMQRRQENINSRDNIISQIASAEAIQKFSAEQTKEQITKLEQEIMTEQFEKQALAEADASIAKLETEKRTIDAKIQGIVSRMSNINKEIAKLSLQEIPVMCPMFDGVTCKSQNEMEPLIKPVKDKYDKLIKETKDLNTQLSPLSAEIKKLDELLIPQRAKQGNAKIKLADIKIAKEQIKELKEQLNNSQDQKFNVDGLLQAKDKVTQAITNNELLLKAIREYEASENTKKNTEEAIQTLQSRIDVWDIIEKAFQPDGIPSKLLAPIMTEIKDKFSDTEYLLGSVEISPDFEFTVNGIHESLLSESEKFRLSILIQDAVCRIAKVPFLIIDRVDILDPANKSKFINIILNLADFYQKIIFFSTADTQKLTMPAIDNLSFLIIENQTITALEPATV